MVPSVPTVEKQHPPHTLTLPPPCLWIKNYFTKMLYYLELDITGYTSHQPTKYFPKNLGDNHNDFVFRKCLAGLFNQQCFSLETLVLVKHRSWTLNQVFDSFVTCLMSPLWTLGLISNWSLLGKFTTVPRCLHLWIKVLTVVHWSSRTFSTFQTQMKPLTFMHMLLVQNFQLTLSCKTGSVQKRPI